MMIETEEQRRWWFATHPEYSSSRRGGRSRRDREATSDSGKVRPKDVDAYVDEALKYESGSVADLLKSVKRNFGTEGERRFAQADRPRPPSDNGAYRGESDGEKRQPTFWHTVVKGVDNTLQAWQRWSDIIAARLPPKGTRERAGIEAARQRGIRAKKAEELENIRAGGKGSGVWTEKELEVIRRTGEFPPDAQWHHNPTVANCPDRAADPRAVHPVRGGRKGHLRDGHKGNWRNPRQ